MQRTRLNTSAEQFWTIVLSELTLTGALKMAGNGDVVEVADKSDPFVCFFISLDFSKYFFFLTSPSISSQVRDEYRTDYDPDILLSDPVTSLENHVIHEYPLTFLVFTP